MIQGSFFYQNLKVCCSFHPFFTPACPMVLHSLAMLSLDHETGERKETTQT